MTGYSFPMMLVAYFIVFLIFVAVIVAAVLIGVAIGKARAKKKEAENHQNPDGEYSDTSDKEPIEIG